MFKNKKILILGMAKSGFEAAKLLALHHNQILVTDQKEQKEEDVQVLKELGVDFIVTEEPTKFLNDSFDYVIKNPGIHRSHPCVQKALELKIPVINEVEMAYTFLPKDISIIGVTGSNGKTTTVTILYEILKESGLPVHLGGNIGYPLSSLVNQIKAGDILVLEISDHQLHDMYDFKTNISILTNLSQVHLDFNGTYENYKQIKKRIFNHHTKHDLAILNQDNQDVVELTKEIPSRKLYFSSQTDSDLCIKNQAIYYLDEKVIDLDMIRVQGNHNYENIMCAIAAAKEFHVSNDAIKSVLNDFSGVEHRMEYVRRLEGREFYNDSKSTNNQSTIIALSSFQKPVILILGGLDRGQSFDELKDSMTYVKHVVCYGQTKEKIETFCLKNQIDCVVLDDLESAVKVAYNLSEEEDVILFSPACASQDQFQSFEERGKLYKQYVENL